MGGQQEVQQAVVARSQLLTSDLCQRLEGAQSHQTIDLSAVVYDAADKECSSRLAPFVVLSTVDVASEVDLVSSALIHSVCDAKSGTKLSTVWLHAAANRAVKWTGFSKEYANNPHGELAFQGKLLELAASHMCTVSA